MARRHRLLLLLFLAAAACQVPSREETRIMLGTYVRIKAYGRDTSALRRGIDDAFAACARVDRAASTFMPTSAVARLNATGRAALTPELADILRLAQQVSRLTGGAFDITIYPLEEAWGFYGDHYRRPDSAQLDRARRRVGPDRITLTADSVYLAPGTRIDLAAIAKGYAVDQAMLALARRDLRTALVDAGGDIRVLGTKPDRRPWQIGLRDPRQEGLCRVLAVRSGAVATSGDYEKYFIADGVRYHHILDPRTGYPPHEVASATAFAADAATADAFATAFVVLGVDSARALADRTPGIACILLTADDGCLHEYRSSGAP